MRRWDFALHLSPGGVRLLIDKDFCTAHTDFAFPRSDMAKGGVPLLHRHDAVTVTFITLGPQRWCCDETTMNTNVNSSLACFTASTARSGVPISCKITVMRRGG